MKILTSIEDISIYLFIQNFLYKYYPNLDLYKLENSDDFENCIDFDDFYIFFIEINSIDKSYIWERFVLKSNFNNIYVIMLDYLIDVNKFKEYKQKGIDSYLQLPLNEIYLNVQILSAQKVLNHRKNIKNLKKSYSILKDMQNKFVESEKLVGVGMLAADIANEIYDPLSFLLSNVQILDEYSKKYENILDLLVNCADFSTQESEEACNNIAKLWESEKMYMIRLSMSIVFRDTKDGLNRISTIVSELKNFSKINQLNQKDMADLNENINSTLVVAKNELKYNCKVTFNRGKIPFIFINAGEINQVILTILINAVGAIKRKNSSIRGKIIIDTYIEKDFVCCSIKDNGCGMSQDKIEHLFNSSSLIDSIEINRKSKGLGLILAYDIVHLKHMGEIVVKSELNMGSEFIIKLPIKSR